MKLLFTVALLIFPFCGFAAKPEKPAAPATEEPKPERKPTPGFWERAWDSTKKGTKRIGTATKNVGSAVVSPFSKKDKKANSSESLVMTVTIDPAQIKLPATRSMKVKVDVRNQGKFAVQLDFPTTQRVEVLVKSDGGKVISKWSDDQKVDTEQGFLVINSDERLEYTATISTRGMEAGKSYVVDAFFPSYDTLRTSRMVSPVN